MSIIGKIIGKEPLSNEPPNEPSSEPGQNKRYSGKIIGIVDGDNGGFGFIATPQIPYRRIFFHWTALMPDTLTFDKLEEGMKVEFDAFEHSEKGWRGLRVRVVE